MQTRTAFALLFLSAVHMGCGSSSSSDAAPGAGAAPATGAAEYAIGASIKLSPDADGVNVSFPTMNGAMVAVAIKDIIGKNVYWVTTPGGEPASNAKPLDIVTSTVGSDLTSSFVTAPHYANGPWEINCVISLTGSVLPMIPAAGDLAAFDNSPPPAGDPPPTGASVRVHVADADSSSVLTNRYFVRFGK